MTDKPTITQADREAAIVKTAHAIALSHSNYGDGEGNKRAFAIAADLKKKLPPTNIVSPSVTELQADKDRLDYLAGESLDLRCFPIPTGGDDADIGWRVIGHYMAEPNERIMGEAWTDNPRAAIDDAIANAALAQKEPVE